MGWLQSEKSDTVDLDGETASGTIGIDAYEIQVAAGPTYKMGALSIYGGPFLHFIGGDLNLDGTVGEESGSISFDLKEKSVFGGYVRTVRPQTKPFEVTKGYYLFGEFQFTGDTWGFGTGVRWKF